MAASRTIESEGQTATNCAGGLEGRVPRGPELLGMIALKALIGGPPEISGPGEPLVRSIRIPSWRKLISEAGLELRVVPSALLLILGEDIPGLVAVTPASAATAKSAYRNQYQPSDRRGLRHRQRLLARGDVE